MTIQQIFSPHCLVSVFLLLTNLCTAVDMLAQSRTDTTVLDELEPMQIIIKTYDAQGTLREVAFGTRIDAPISQQDYLMEDLVNLSKQAKFIMEGKVLYDDSGKPLYPPIEPSFELIETKYIFKPRTIQAKHIDHSFDPHVVFPDRRSEAKRKIVFNGLIGTEADLTIELGSLNERKTQFKLYTLTGKIKHPPSIVLARDFETQLPIKAQFKTGIEKETLIFENEYGEKSEILIEINGHDLTSADFQDSLEDSQTVILEKRNKLVIKSDGEEKLIRLKRDEEVIQNISYAKKRMEINFKGLKSGLYILDAINLGNNTHKYAKVDIRR